VGQNFSMDHYLLQPNIRCLGYSGCKVELLERNNGYVISKTSSSPEYNNRLQKQAEKQACYINKYVKAPRVYSMQHIGNLFQVEMEFINGTDFTQFLELSTVGHLADFGRLLIDYIDDAVNSSYLVDISKITADKIDSVRLNILNNKFAAKYVDLVPDACELLVPVGSCHGDLTLSNIVWRGGSVFVIDLLDSFIDSPLIDIVKLRQDTFHVWSLDRSTSNFDRAKVSLALSFLDRIIVDHCFKYDWYISGYEFFQRLNLCRVLQYAQSTAIVNLLIKELDRVRIGSFCGRT